MTHIAVDSVLPAEVYNRLLIDHVATELAASLNLKLNYVHPLTKILHIHGVSDCVELHVLHRHFALEEGEVVLHRSLTIPGPGGNTGITVDISKAVPCPNLAKLPLFPLMWMASSTGKLIPYEYGILEDGFSHHGKIKDISHETWEAFTQDFSTYVRATGLQDIIALKDKSCMTGGEYVIPSLRAVFRIPYSIINLQASSRLIETGWTVEHSAAALEVDGPLPSPEPTDGHVTKVKKTTHGPVALYPDTEKEGPGMFDAKEVDPVYTDEMLGAVESSDFFNFDVGLLGALAVPSSG